MGVLHGARFLPVPPEERETIPLAVGDTRDVLDLAPVGKELLYSTTTVRLLRQTIAVTAGRFVG